MAKDSLLNINYIENSTIYDLPPDLDVVADDLLLIARPNYKNKYTKRIDKDYPYEGYNSTISQLSSQVAETMLLKNEVILGKWRFIHNPIVLDNYKLTGNVSGKTAATKWYVDDMYKRALKKLYDLSAYIYDEDNPHIPSYVGMIITTSINSESRIKEIYGGNHWQLTCENKFLVGANDLMDPYKFNVIGGNDTIKLTVNQSPVAFHEHYIGCSKSRTFNTANYSIPTISSGGRAHRRHSHLHDYLVAGATVVAFVAAVVVATVLAIGSGGTASGFSVALTNSVGTLMSTVISGLIVGAVSMAAATLATWALGKFTEFSASAIKNIMLGAQIAAAVASFCNMYFDFTGAAANGTGEAAGASAGASGVQTATQSEISQTAKTMADAATAGSQSTSAVASTPTSQTAKLMCNIASSGSNTTASAVSVPASALNSTSSGASGLMSNVATSGAQTVSSVSVSLTPSVQTPTSLMSSIATGTGTSAASSVPSTAASMMTNIASNGISASDSALINIAAKEIAQGTAKGPALGALLTKVAEAGAKAVSAVSIPVGTAVTASQLLSIGGGTALTLAQYGVGMAAACHTLGYINSLTNHLVPSTPNYQLVGKRSLDEFNAGHTDFPRKIKQLIEDFNAKWNKGVKHNLTYPTTTTIDGKTYTFDGQSQMNQAVNNMETAYDNMVDSTDSALANDMEVNRETLDTETNTEFNNRTKPTSVDDKYRCPSCKLYEFIYTNESTTQGHCNACGFTGLRPRSAETENKLSVRSFPDVCPNSSNGKHSMEKSYTSLDSSSPVMIKNECKYCHNSYETEPTAQDFQDLEKYNCQNSVDPRTSFTTISMGSMPIAVNLKYTSNGLDKNTEVAAKTSINMRPKYFGLYIWKRIS